MTDTDALDAGLTRYCLVAGTSATDGEVFLVKETDPDGEWVRHEDAAARIAALEQCIAGAEKECAQLERVVDARGNRIADLEARLAEAEEARDAGATFVLDALAKALGLERWTIHDGSEEWEGDVRGTLYGILREAKVFDPETDKLATVALADATKRIEALEAELVDADRDRTYWHRKWRALSPASEGKTDG